MVENMESGVQKKKNCVEAFVEENGWSARIVDDGKRFPECEM
jgi:hypothetical protein